MLSGHATRNACTEPRRLYSGGVSELRDHLVRVQEIADRARDFQGHEGADPKAFTKVVVEDVGDLAEAVAELIRRSGP
jgi:hypothetical protein